MPGVAHRVVEEARACAAQTARDANQYLDDVVEPYFKEVDEEVDKLVEELHVRVKGRVWGRQELVAREDAVRASHEHHGLLERAERHAACG